MGHIGAFNRGPQQHPPPPTSLGHSTSSLSKACLGVGVVRERRGRKMVPETGTCATDFVSWYLRTSRIISFSSLETYYRQDRFSARRGSGEPGRPRPREQRGREKESRRRAGGDKCGVKEIEGKGKEGAGPGDV